PPIHNTRRYVAEDCLLAGQALKAGDAILVVLAAANRDPAANPQPHAFDPERAQPICFTFGHGAHACPGARIAVTLAVIGVQALLARGLDFAAIAGTMSYAASVNARIPVFGAYP
ncbi:MAG TPA: cytochrome P450, partial [Alphaproteobacteria bacterium]|nr:cytochrome P450 [Alphaproteobacteria bacterium]